MGDEKQFGYRVGWPYYSVVAGPFAPPRKLIGSSEFDNGKRIQISKVHFQETYPQTCNECSHIDDNICENNSYTTCTDKNEYFQDRGVTCGCKENYIGGGTAAQPCRNCNSSHNCMHRRSGCGGDWPDMLEKDQLLSCLSSASENIFFDG